LIRLWVDGKGFRMKKAPPIPACVKSKLRDRVYALAAEHCIPPVFITAHIRVPKAIVARNTLMVECISKYGLARYQVAQIFGRDRRRIRRSVLGV
jgi:hypothetical protein